MRRLVLALLVACQSSAPSKPEGGDISVPKMPPDAAANGSSPPGSTDPVASVKTYGASHGWRFEADQTQPKYVENAELAPELHAAGKAGNLVLATVDEHIEECSSAGGSHILFKAKIGGAEAFVHWGGHGIYLSPGPKQGGFVILAIEKLPAPESIEKKAFCVPARTVAARAKVVLEVAQERDGERLLADLAK